MTFFGSSRFAASRLLVHSLLTGAAVLVLAACGAGRPSTESVQASERAELTPPPLALAPGQGLKDDVYFNAELKEATLRLAGMQMKLKDIEGDLQGSALAMQRVEAMREELDTLEARFRALQSRLGSDGTVVDGLPPVSIPTAGPMGPVTVTTTTTNIPATESTPAQTVTRRTTVVNEGTLPADARISGTMTPESGAASTEKTVEKIVEKHVAPETGVAGGDAASAPVSLTTFMGASQGETPAPAAKADKMQPVVEGAKAETAKPKETPKQAETAQIAPKPGSGVGGVRVGTHAGYVRIVLDVAGDAAFTTNLDSGEKLLTVELPKAKWSAATSQTIGNNPVLASYTAQDAGEGSVVAFVLKGDTKVTGTSTLKAVGGKSARVVIDLAK